MSRTKNSITLVCYDITSDKLRSKIDKCMKDFGVRMQHSVFLCHLDIDGVERCRDKLDKVLKLYHNIKEPGDSLIMFERFNLSVAVCILGERLKFEEPTFEIF